MWGKTRYTDKVMEDLDGHTVAPCGCLPARWYPVAASRRSNANQCVSPLQTAQCHNQERLTHAIARLSALHLPRLFQKIRPKRAPPHPLGKTPRHLKQKKISVYLAGSVPCLLAGKAASQYYSWLASFRIRALMSDTCRIRMHTLASKSCFYTSPLTAVLLRLLGFDLPVLSFAQDHEGDGHHGGCACTETTTRGKWHA